MGDTDRDRVTRRELLAVNTAAVMGSFSGCSSLIQQNSGSTHPLPTLCGCRVQNYHNEPHTIYVLIERGDKILHWTSHELKPDAGKTITLGEWHKKPGNYVISGSFDGLGVWDRRDLTEVDAEECILPSVEVMEDESLRVVALL